MPDMRTLVHGAMAEARDIMGQVVDDLRQGAELSDDEVLARYETQHRGKPLAMLEFAQSRAPADPLNEALRYEQEMEKLRARKIGQGG